MGFMARGAARLGKTFLDDAVELADGEVAPSIFKNSLKAAKKWGAVDGAVSGGAEGIEQAQEGDFDLSDLLMHAGGGAIAGGLTGGLGNAIGMSRLKKGGLLGGIMKGAGLLGSAGHNIDLNTTESAAAAPGGSKVPGMALGGESSAEGLMSFFSGVGAVPEAPTMGLTDYMNNNRLNQMADDQINTELIPLKAQQQMIRRDLDSDLASNSRLGVDINNQMSNVARDHSAETQAIADNSAANRNINDTEADATLAQSGATMVGDEATRATLAAERAAQDTTQQARSMQDSELLQRLGVSGQEMLAEMQQAENMQTGQNAIRLRTSANDAITENRANQGSVQAKRSGILGSLAQGQMDASMQKYQAGLEGYKTKLATATAKADGAKAEFEMAGQSAAPSMKMSDLLKPSGLTVMNPGTGHADPVPYVATLPPEVALQYMPEQTYNMWQGIMSKAEGEM